MKEVTVTVQTGRKDVVLTVSQETKIETIIQEAVKEAGYDPNGKYVLLLGEERLDPQRTLVSYHVGEQVTLVLTDAGGGACE